MTDLPATEVMVQAKSFSCGYNGIRAVHDIDFHVARGEVVALLGPNGAGKTTTLLGISGVLAPMSGELMVAGEPVDHRRAYRMARRGVAHVPEDRGLLPRLTVAENLRLGARGRSIASSDVLDLFPALQPLLGRRAGLLSGGEQQMLSLARALVSDPSVVLIDEMSLGLAPLIVRDLVAKVREVVATTGAAVLLVEQHVHMALSVADRAYAMSRGRIVLEGTATELAEQEDLLRAGYLGGFDVGAEA